MELTAVVCSGHDVRGQHFFCAVISQRRCRSHVRTLLHMCFLSLMRRDVCCMQSSDQHKWLCNINVSSGCAPGRLPTESRNLNDLWPGTTALQTHERFYFKNRSQICLEWLKCCCHCLRSILWITALWHQDMTVRNSTQAVQAFQRNETLAMRKCAPSVSNSFCHYMVFQE